MIRQLCCIMGCLLHGDPQVTPLQRTSNPFCPITPNKTGWREYIEQKEFRMGSGFREQKEPRIYQEFRVQGFGIGR